jgi:F-type H+-transporting ATPase subunit a
MAGHAPDPMHEVQDHVDKWVLFEQLFKEEVAIPLFSIPLGSGYRFAITKFMILELIAAGLLLLIFIPLARRIRAGGLPQGRFWNLFEGLLIFVRDEICRPNLDGGHAHEEHAAEGHGHGHGEHASAPAHAPARPSDRFVPFFWTLFLFLLFCNLLGMIPFMGSPTASIWVTGGMALISFIMFHAAAIAKVGVIRYFVSLWPKIDVPYVGWIFSLMIYVIELFGTAIKGGVLAVRLFANMFAGHMVLANILLFIYVVGNASGLSALWGGVTVASVLGVVALSLLELFVAFLQAYVFTFLTALFMGMSLNPEH